MKDWETKTLKEFCVNYKQDIVDGPFGANLKREHYVNEGIPVLKIQNIKPFNIKLKKMDYISPEKADELQRHGYTNGDIIITKLGLPLGAAAIVKDLQDGVIVADLVRVRAQKIDTQYLCYHLNSSETNAFLNSQQGGATRPRVQISAVRELPIAAPSLAEQKRIVAILDEAFEGIDRAIALAEKNLANSRELFESYLNAIFTQKGDGWVEKKLEDICEVKDGTHESPKYVESGIPFITQKNIRENGLTFENIKFILSYDHEKFYARSNVASEDILISMIGANRGMACVVDTERIFSIKNVGLIKASKNVNRYFLLYFLKSKKAQMYVESASRGGAQPFIGLGKLREFSVSVASQDSQSTIVMKLDELGGETQRLEAK